MQQIQIFENPQFGAVRTIIDDNNTPMFCALDVAKALGYATPAKAVIDHCKGVSKIETPTENQHGTIVMQKIKYIREADIYRLVMRSKLPDAEKFQDWVCEEVLPSIRKNGGYIVTKAEDTPDMIMARAILVAQETIEKQKQLLIEQAKQIETDAPKVSFANAILASKTSCLVGELAKIITQNGYEIGQNRLFAWMRENGYLGTTGERRNIPNQQYVEQGLFELKKGTHSGNDGVMHSTITIKVTTKGQKYFINKFLAQLPEKATEP